MAGSPPKRPCHMPWLRIVTGGAPGRSSSAWNTRPSAGATPSTSKKSCVTRRPSIFSGAPLPLSVALCPVTAAIDSNTSLCDVNNA